jgi:ubiquitin-protein ligase
MVKVAVQGSEGSPYHEGSFQFKIMFGRNYPFEAPVVQCLSKIYHPQVSLSGDMKLEFLNDWVPTCTLRHLIEFIARSLVQIDLRNTQQPAIGFEYEHNRPQFELTAIEWTKELI